MKPILLGEDMLYDLAKILASQLTSFVCGRRLSTIYAQHPVSAHDYRRHAELQSTLRSLCPDWRCQVIRFMRRMIRDARRASGVAPDFQTWLSRVQTLDAKGGHTTAYKPHAPGLFVKITSSSPEESDPEAEEERTVHDLYQAQRSAWFHAMLLEQYREENTQLRQELEDLRASSAKQTSTPRTPAPEGASATQDQSAGATPHASTGEAGRSPAPPRAACPAPECPPSTRAPSAAAPARQASGRPSHEHPASIHQAPKPMSSPEPSSPDTHAASGF